jgi:hypothetical protein
MLTIQKILRGVIDRFTSLADRIAPASVFSREEAAAWEQNLGLEPKRDRRLLLVSLMAVLLVISASAGLVFYSTHSGPASAGEIPELDPEKPVYNWWVCADLGVGPVPGESEPRQRLRLCHNKGWEVKVYCLRPDLPVPPLDRTCTRVSEDTYWCGDPYQPVREYNVLQTPTNTPTSAPTNTPTSTPTNTPTNTPTSTPTNTPIPIDPTLIPRTPPGGEGNSDLPRPPDAMLDDARSGSSPFRGFFPTVLPQGASPFPATPTPRAGSSSGEQAVEAPKPDFDNRRQTIRLLIYPKNHKVNDGKPIEIAFIPGKNCGYQDHRACINYYPDSRGAPVTFVTVHSGVGGEGQQFRHAVEGTGPNQAQYSLADVRKHLQALQGSEVVIEQGDRIYNGYRLGGAVRIPPQLLSFYLRTPVSQVLSLAARVDGELTANLLPDSQRIVFETCGWWMPEEEWVGGISTTSASIYLGVIEKVP